MTTGHIFSPPVLAIDVIHGTTWHLFRTIFGVPLPIRPAVSFEGIIIVSRHLGQVLDERGHEGHEGHSEINLG
jgi:hypothetical protein